MTATPMSYKFIPSGHTRQEGRVYTKPGSNLRQTFDKWFSLHDKYGFGKQPDALNWRYRSAFEWLGKESFSLDEAHGLLVEYQDRKSIEEAGMFVSAAYNLSNEDVIVYDLETDSPPNYLGYMLSSGKVFVNKGHAGHRMGMNAQGTVVNESVTGSYAGTGSKLIINASEAFSVGSFADAIINFDRAGNIGKTKLLINMGQKSTFLLGSDIVVEWGLHNPYPDPTALIYIDASSPKKFADLDVYVAQLMAGFVRSRGSGDYSYVQGLSPDRLKKDIMKKAGISPIQLESRRLLRWLREQM